MRRKLLQLSVITLVAMTANAAYAAVDSVDILIKALVEKNIITEDDAAAVRAEVALIRQDEEAAKKSAPVTGKRPIKLSGYVQERYTSSNQDGANDFLDAKRVRLSLAGEAATRVDFKLQLDFAGSRKGLTEATLTPNADPTKIKLGTKSAVFGKPLLLDAVIGYTFQNDSRLAIGQFKLPFGLENLTSSTNLDTINRTLTTESLVPGRDTGNQGRDIGVLWSGAKPLGKDGVQSIDYSLGLFNGAGINVGDDNGRKDPAARVVWNFGPAGAHIGASYFDGAVGLANTAHKRTGTELVYAKGPYTLKGEYVWGKDADVEKKGWYTTLVRQWSASTQGVIRYDQIDPNTSVADDYTGVLTIGFNRFLTKDGSTRWQLNYETRSGQGTQPSYNQLLAQFQTQF
ncbi:MAG: porin [Armatimonadota bacterium]